MLHPSWIGPPGAGWQDASVPDASPPPVLPAAGERGLSSWEPADLAGLVVPAWDTFCEMAEHLDLEAATRLPGWTARDVCVHLGSWPGSRSLERLLDEARAGGPPTDGEAAHTNAGHFDQEAHNEAVVAAHRTATHDEVLTALHAARDAAADFLESPESGQLGTTTVRSVLGPLPLSAVVSAASYELAVHALDLAPPGRPNPRRTCCQPGWPRWST